MLERKKQVTDMRITFVVRSDVNFSRIPITMGCDEWWTDLIKRTGLADVVAVTSTVTTVKNIGTSAQ